MRKYIDAQIMETCGINEAGIMNALPRGLRKEVCEALAGEFVRTAPLLASLPASFTESLMIKMAPVVFAKGAIIIRKGDIGEDMFFIKSGKVAIVIGNPTCGGMCVAESAEGAAGQNCCKVIAILSKGDCFGEQALLDKTTRNASAIALSPCTLYSLSHEDFDHVVNYNGYEDNVMKVLSFVRKNASACRVIEKTMDRLTATFGDSRRAILQRTITAWRENRRLNLLEKSTKYSLAAKLRSTGEKHEGPTTNCNAAALPPIQPNKAAEGGEVRDGEPAFYQPTPGSGGYSMQPVTKLRRGSC